MEENTSEYPKTPEKPFLTSDIILAEYFSLRQLPGFLRHYLPLGVEEYGMKVSRGHVAKELPPHQQGIVHRPIGWAIKGVEGPGAVRVRTSLVQLRPVLLGIISGDQAQQPLDVFLSATVQVDKPPLFYGTMTPLKPKYRCSDLANEIVGCLMDVLRQPLGEYAAQTLIPDVGGEVSKHLVEYLRPFLSSFLHTRGVQLISFDVLGIRPSAEEDTFVKEMDDLRSQVVQDQAHLNGLLDRVVTALQTGGLVTPEEVADLRATYRQSAQRGVKVLGRLVDDRFAQWREEQLKGRLAQLKTTDRPAGETEKVHKKGKGWLPVIIYSLLAIAIGSGSVVLYWFRFSKLGNLDLNPGHVIAGASVLALLGVGLLLITQVITDRLLHFVISKIKEHLLQRRLSQAKKAIPKTEPAPVEDSRNGVEANISQPLESRSIGMKETSVPGKVETWLTQESLKVDENVRRHVAKEMGISISNLTDARFQALRTKHNGLAQTMKDLIDRIEAFRVNVQGAAFYGSIINNRKGEIRGHASELLNFQEDLQRQAQVFQLNSQRLLDSIQDTSSNQGGPSSQGNSIDLEAQLKMLVSNLRQLERHFSRREAVMEGVGGLESPVTPLSNGG